MAGSGVGRSSLEKAGGSGDCLARLGQSTVALRLDDGQKQFEVTVTPTRLR